MEKSMKAKKLSSRESLVLLATAGFIWSKMGVGAAVKDTGLIRDFTRFQEYPPKAEIGYMSQAAWQATYGGSQLDYEDWLKGV
jgi:hypothetical protein